ncbi:5'-methylthioadenosine/S-adenosylhomocysteine nucleosidase [Candidatus Entotheonellaceae bacterium PAL068K]
MNRLIVVPTQAEIDGFLQGCTALGFPGEAAWLGRLPVVQLPELGVTVAHGGLGKAQFALQTQHLLDACSDWDVVICAGAAGALVEALAPGDIVVATETVEHDLRPFGRPLLPRFRSAETALAALREGRLAQTGFTVHFGPIASGDEAVGVPERRSAIHQLTGALAVAWEGAGGARACHFSRVSFIEVRGITDHADSQAVADFKRHLTRTMQHVAMLLTAWARRQRR